MPAHLLPQEIREARGSFINHPEKRKKTPTPKSLNPLGNPPAGMTKEEKDIWFEVIDINPPGVLTSSDRLTVEMLCRLMRKFRDREPALSGPEWSRLAGALSSLGMTPADRQRVTSVDVKTANPFNEFAVVA